MKTHYLRSPCKVWFYLLSENATICVFNAHYYASIGSCAVIPSDLHSDLIECSEVEYIMARNEVLQRLGVEMQRLNPPDFRLSYLADFTGL